ncbi:alpha/beta hydrolase [Streptomyces apocyni]|uniref:alpha/beta hydrolase n=1 Tax=Streptomyces apocyni TaxID=2654677 RepID=UPI0012E9AB1D|nr:alpha/beta hydrolase [Streptomyces apocyni]
MTSFDSSPQATVTRALLALAVVFVMLAITGWTTVHHNRAGRSPLQVALDAWERGGINGHQLPAADAPTTRIAEFFDSLTAGQRHRLAARYPLVVGNLNGVPPRLRYRANRLALAEAREAEREHVDDQRLSDEGRRTVRRRMHRFTALLHEDRQILAFDPTGSGRVAEVFGDLERAQRVSVVVPGVGTDLLTFQKTEGEYTAPVGMARSLYDAERTESRDTRTAVIAWADYTAPAGIGMEAATSKRAEDGARRLDSLVWALPGSSSVTLYCHSYGSVVCGVAARGLSARVTDIAVAGSPGMGTESAAGLGTSARVWAVRGADDWIGDIPHLKLGGLGHGADPVSPDFGARVLAAGDSGGHTGYFLPDSASVRNLARIGVGAYDAVRCDGGGTACRKTSSGFAAS